MSVKSEAHKAGQQATTTAAANGGQPQECAGCGKKIQDRYNRDNKKKIAFFKNKSHGELLLD